MKFHFYYVTFVAAMAIEAFAAYFSIYGLATLLGKITPIIGIAIAIEFGKVTLVSYMYNWLKRTPNPLKTILWGMISGAMIVTSIGIFGYFTNSFQQNQGKFLATSDIQTRLNQSTTESIKSDITLYQEQLNLWRETLKRLFEAKTSQEKRLNEALATLNYRFINSLRSDILRTENDIANANKEISNLILQIQQRNQSLATTQQQKYNIQTERATKEIGPYDSFAKIFNKKPEDIVGYVIIMLMFLADPFAICLFLITNVQILALRKPVKVEEPEKQKRQYTKKKNKTMIDKYFYGGEK